MFKFLAKLFGTETASPILDARLCVEGMDHRFSPVAPAHAGVPVRSGPRGVSVGAAPAATYSSDGSDAAGHWVMTVGG